MKPMYRYLQSPSLASSLFAVLLLTIAFLLATSAIGASAPAAPISDEIDWYIMAKGLFGGLALFLFGMEQMSDALKSALGDQMKDLLAKLTRTRFSAVLTGGVVTAIIQSSSVTTVLVVGFVSAGMMSMAQSVGVIMGANIGTTVTAQIVAFNIGATALWMVAIGFLLLFASKSEKPRHYGAMLMGLGLIFYGMDLMGGAMNPLRSYEPFLDLMAQLDNALFAILIGAGFTALVQSSSATTAISITLAAQGLITLEAGIGLAFGANIGTCVTALLATLGKSREALRAAMVHVLFNVAGVIIWLPFVSVLAGWVIGISPSSPELEGTARLAAEVPRQIANAHTIFNIANTIIFIGFTTQLARLVQKMVPDKVVEEKVIIEPRYLDYELTVTPSLALQNVRFEIARMGEIVGEMFAELRSAMLNRDRAALTDIQRKDDQVDVLEGAILRYLSTLRKMELSEQEGEDIALSMKATDLFESVGDVIETELVNLGYKTIDKDIKTSDTMRHLLVNLGEKLQEAIENTIKAVKEQDQIAADEVITVKADIDQLLSEALRLQSQGLMSDESAIDAMRIEMTYLDNMKRIHTYLKRLVREILPKEVSVIED